MNNRSTQKTRTTKTSTVQILAEKEIPKPVNLEVETPDQEPVAPAPAAEKEKVETDVRSKLSKKTDNEDIFVPTNPVALEKAAEAVAKEQGFDFNRGTSIGARLIAKANKLV